jgi:hypothetical protein
MSSLILKRASASRSSGQWGADDYDVLENGGVVGRIFKVPAAAPEGPPLDVGKRPRPPHRARGARLCGHPRSGDGGVREELAARVTLGQPGPSLSVVGAPLLTAQQRRSPQPILTQENLSELLMVTDAKLSLQNRRHDAMGGRFGLLVRGLRSGDTDCAGPDNRHPNRNRHHDELADAAWHDRLHLSNHKRTLSPV